jgi:hypothetical protein
MLEKSLFELGSRVYRLFTQVIESVSKSPIVEPTPSERFDIESECQRFGLWAKNLGLFLKGHGSLDYRLRDADDVRTFTRDILLDLANSLQHGMTSLQTKWS